MRNQTNVAVALALALALALGACGGGGGGESTETAADCSGCHATQAAAFEDNVSSHALLFDCALCHAELRSEPGPGHREVARCAECHSEATHPPRRAANGAASPTGAATGQAEDDPGCARCHEPHGTSNLYLIRSELRLRDGRSIAIELTNIHGRADGSFAELATAEGGTNGREPGTGLCEVCHAATRYYDATGTGEPHHGERCTRCHDHAQAFLPLSRATAK